MLSQYLQKVKSRIEKHKSDLFAAALIFLVGMASFGLGRLSTLWHNKAPMEIMESDGTQSPQESPSSFAAGDSQTASTVNPLKTPGTPVGDVRRQYVASRSGSSYHFPWCPGAAKIKQGNKIWFATKEEAVAKGYKPASNCPGL